MKKKLGNYSSGYIFLYGEKVKIVLNLNLNFYEMKIISCTLYKENSPLRGNIAGEILAFPIKLILRYSVIHSFYYNLLINYTTRF
jgi:hypothetical protein